MTIERDELEDRTLNIYANPEMYMKRNVEFHSENTGYSVTEFLAEYFRSLEAMGFKQSDRKLVFQVKGIDLYFMVSGVGTGPTGSTIVTLENEERFLK